MWQYALVGLNVRVSAVARAATAEREIQIWNSSARSATQAKEAVAVSSASAKAIKAALRYTKWEQAELEILINSKRALNNAQLDSFRRFLKAHFPRTEFYISGAEGTPNLANLRPGTLGEFVVNPSGANYICIQPNSTGYVLAHEYLHLVHYSNVVETYGAEAFEVWNALSTSTKEQMVYNGLRDYWRFLTGSEQLHATRYLMNQGGFAGD